jgi:zinc/manganese transport system substrate-binding protein
MEMRMSTIATFAGVVLLFAASAWGQAAAQTVHIVAAENFYGDVAQQLAGPDVKVTSILSNPDDDPHMFEVSPSVARDLSAATIVIANGADYDPWMEKLLGASKSSSRKTINVAELVHKKAGDNPHLWYDPVTMPAFARALTASLSAADPAHKADYERRLQDFSVP